MFNKRAPRCALAELEDRGLIRAVNGEPREEAANDQIDTASSKRIIV
jgi:hypothetical protein